MYILRQVESGMFYMRSTVVGDTVRVHKDSLREGENSVALTVFGSLAGRLVMTSTLNVTKVGSTPPPPPPPPPPG